MASPNLALQIPPSQSEQQPKNHPVFGRFSIFKGDVPNGYFANFLGVLTRLDYFNLDRPEIAEGYHKNYPHFDELYFEWIDLLQAVVSAEDHFTLIELGAGWGRWMANAVAALKQSNNLPYTLIGVEAEPTHFRWITEHLSRNGVDLNRCQLIEAAVTAEDGTVGFFTGQHETWGGPGEWYGQSVGGQTMVRSISLKAILAPLQKVDLLDMDIQGAEYEVVQAAAEEVDQKVKRVHIETHNREVEKGLRSVFTRLGWKCVHDFPCSLEYPKLQESATDFGVVGFLGGVQSWVNPKFVPPSELASLTDKLIPTSVGIELRGDATDWVSKILLKDRIYEVPETDIVSRIVRPGDVCIDAGCHMGYFTCLMGRLVGTKGQIYAFDANPLQVQRTRRNAVLNDLLNVEVIHAALGDQLGGAALFNLAPDDQTGLSSLGQIPSYQRTITVPWSRLENFLGDRDIDRVRLLKLDVEGAEELVLKGLGKYLQRHSVDFLLVECNDERLRSLDTSTSRVANLLHEAGYTCWSFSSHGKSAWNKCDSPQSRDDVNYLFSSPAVGDEVPMFSLAGALLGGQKVLQDARRAGLTGSAPSGKQIPIVTPAEAFWRQRGMLAASKERILSLSAAIGRPTDLTVSQWAQIAAFTEEFRPDFILELGRGTGNSTACFTEVANHLGAGQCHVLSLCLSDNWRKQSVPKIRRIVSPDWFAPLEALECDILKFDIATPLAKAQRVVVFWDAHGFELAEWVLGELLPKIAFKPHLVMMHDLADLRYCSPQRAYGEERLWKGTSAGEQSMWLGHIYSRVAQSISIIDFTTRNKLPLHSGDESFFQEIGTDPGKVALLKNMLGDELFGLYSHWFWFSLAEADGELTFPKFLPAVETVIPGNNEFGAPGNELEAIKNSRAWRLMSRLHGIRDAAAPKGSLQRRIYDSLLRPRRG